MFTEEAPIPICVHASIRTAGKSPQFDTRLFIRAAFHIVAKLSIISTHRRRKEYLISTDSQIQITRRRAIIWCFLHLPSQHRQKQVIPCVVANAPKSWSILLHQHPVCCTSDRVPTHIRRDESHNLISWGFFFFPGFIRFLSAASLLLRCRPFTATKPCGRNRISQNTTKAPCAFLLCRLRSSSKRNKKKRRVITNDITGQHPQAIV